MSTSVAMRYIRIATRMMKVFRSLSILKDVRPSIVSFLEILLKTSNIMCNTEETAINTKNGNGY